MRTKKTKKIVLEKVKTVGYGNEVFVGGIVRMANKNKQYCEVEILDNVCGMPICKVTCHIEGVYRSKL